MSEPQSLPIKYHIDVGWPWTQDKMMCTCAVCGLGMFIPFGLADDSTDKFKHVPVHEFCLEKAKAKYE